MSAFLCSLFAIFFCAILAHPHIWAVSPAGSALNYYQDRIENCSLPLEFSVKNLSLPTGWNITGFLSGSDGKHFITLLTYSNGTEKLTKSLYFDMHTNASTYKLSDPIPNINPITAIKSAKTEHAFWIFSEIDSQPGAINIILMDVFEGVKQSFNIALNLPRGYWSVSIDSKDTSAYFVTWTPTVKGVQLVDLHKERATLIYLLNIPPTNKNDQLLSTWDCDNKLICAIFWTSNGTNPVTQYYYSVVSIAKDGSSNVNNIKRAFAFSPKISPQDALTQSQTDYSDKENVFVQYLSGPNKIYYFEGQGDLFLESETCKFQPNMWIAYQNEQKNKKGFKYL